MVANGYDPLVNLLQMSPRIKRCIATMLTLLFAFSSSGARDTCQHPTQTPHSATGGVHRVAEHDMQRHHTPEADVPSRHVHGTVPPTPRHTVPDCGALMSCYAPIGAIAIDAIVVDVKAMPTASPVGPVLQQSLAEREVESPPPRS